MSGSILVDDEQRHPLIGIPQHRLHSEDNCSHYIPSLRLAYKREIKDNSKLMPKNEDMLETFVLITML